MQQAKFYLDFFSALDRESSSASIHRRRLAYLFDWQPLQEEEGEEWRVMRVSVVLTGAFTYAFLFSRGGGNAKMQQSAV